MDKVEIKNISGNLILSTCINKGSKRKFLLMKEDYVTLKFSADDPIHFKLGDYANIPGDPTGLFELIDLYQPIYNASTGGYDYELRLDAYYRKWKNKKFFLTPQTGGREASWNCTGTLDVHLSIFLRNLNALGYKFRGQAFEYDIDTSVVEQTAKFIQYDNINLLDALTRMAEAWECEWWIAGNKICFGRCESGDPVDFELNVNVDSMTRSDSRTNYATRIYAFGSTRNIPPYYRKSLIFEVGEVSNEYIVDTKRPLKDFFLGKGFGLSKIDISPSKLVCPLDAQERTKVFSKTLQIGKALGKIGYTFDASAFDIVLSSSISIMSLEIWGVVTIAGKETTYGNEITLSPNDKQTIHLSNFPVQLNSDTEDLQVLVEIYFKNTGKNPSSCMADFSGSLSFNADKAIYPTKVNFSSGVNKGKSLDAYAIYDSGLKERRLRIDTTGVLVGDTFTLSSVCYNKVPLSYFTSDLDDLVVNGIVQKRLMLPAGINCIEAFPDMKQEEAVEDIVIFEDVFPRRTAGISEVTPTTEPERDDKGNETGQTIYTYTFIDEGLKNFSNDYLLSEQELRANFQTGSLGGMSFELILKDTGDWGTKFEIKRNEDYGLILPNEWLKPTNGDTYILSGFDTQFVSDLMIQQAEKELKSKAVLYAEKPKIDPSTYDCTLYSEYAFGIDPQSGKQDERFAKRFDIGQRVNLLNKAYFENGRISRIIGFELNLDIPYDSPVYTVGETAPYSRVGELEEKVDALTYKGQAFTPTSNSGSGIYIIGRYDKTSPTDRNVYSSLRTDKEIDERSLSKLHDDKTDFHIDFNNGITVGLKDNPVTLNGVLSSAITEEGELSSDILSSQIIEDGEPLEGELPTGFPYLTGVTGSGNGEVIFHLQGADGIVWNAAHSHAWSQITGRPTKLSDFKNDLTFPGVDLSSYYTKEDCNKEFATKDELSGYLKSQKFRGIGYRPTSSLAQTSLLSDTDSIPLVLVGGNNVSLNRVAGTTNELRIDVSVPSVDLSGYATIKQLSGYVPLTGNVTVKGNTRFEQGCYNIALSTANAKYMRLCVLTVNGTYVNTPLTFSLSGRSTTSIDHISLKLTNAASSAAHKVQAFSYVGDGSYGSKLKVYKLEETGTVFEIWFEQTQSYDSFRVLNVNVPGGMSLVWSGMGSASLPTSYYSQTSCQLAKVTGVVDWEDILNQPVGSDLTLGRLDPICQNNYIPSSNDTLSHAIYQTHCLANAALSSADRSVNNILVSGSGNAITGATLSDNKITLTKGATFLTQHRGIAYRPNSSLAQSVLLGGTNSDYLVLVGGNNVTLSKIKDTTNELRIDVDLSAYYTASKADTTFATKDELGDYLTVITGSMVTNALGYTPPRVNNYLSGVSGSGNGTITFSRAGLGVLTFNAAHTHDISQINDFPYVPDQIYIQNADGQTGAGAVNAWGTQFPFMKSSSIDLVPCATPPSQNVALQFKAVFGKAAGTVCEGNDARLSDARPASNVYAWAKAANKPTYNGTELTLGALDLTCQSGYVPSTHDTLSHAIYQTHCLANAAYLTAGGAVKRSGDTMTNHLYLSIGENYTHKACVGACDSGVNYAFLQAMTKEGVNKGFIKVGPGLMYNDGVSTYNVLHSGNFNSYALSLNGGAVRGSTRFDMGTYNMVFSTNNSRYMRLCVLTVTNAYVNTPLTFSIHGRSTVSSKDRMVLKLTNAASAAAHQVESFNYVGDGNYGSKLIVYKIEETGTVFEIWLEQTQSYDSFRILDLCIPGNMNLVWSGMTSASLPSSYYSVNDCSNDNNYVPLCGGVTMTGPLELLGSGINADNFGVSAPSFMANASRLGSSSYGIFTGSTWIGIGAKNANTLMIGRSAWNGPINASAQIGLEVTGYATAAGFKVTGKTGFLKANGSVDNNTYLTQHQSLADYVKTSDSRLSDARKASDVHDWAKATTKPDYNGTELALGKLDPICQSNYVPSISDTLSHAICQTHCLANSALSIANEAVKDILVSGSGNAITGATLSDNKITLTKGVTFLTQHAYRGIGYRPSSGLAQLSLIGSSDSIPLVLVGGNNVTLSKISGTTNELRIDVDLSAYYTASKADTTFATKDELGDYLTGITGSMVTKALGYTPANANQLSNYVPLTGGVTMTGTLQIQGENVDADMFGMSAPSFMANTVRLGKSSYGIYTGGSTWIGIGAKDSSTLVIGRSAWNGTISTSTAIGLQVPGHVTASGFKVGTSTGFLKANGSVDNNTYLTAHQSLSNYVSLNGTQTISGTKSFSIVQRMNNNVPLHFGSSGSYRGEVGYDYTNDVFLLASTKNKICICCNAKSLDSFENGYKTITGGILEITSGGINVAGNITAAGTISDRRLKTNLQIVKNAGGLIRSLGGVYTFNYTDEAHRLNEYLPNEDYGLIYQNVKKTLPDFTSELNNGYGCVKYEKFIPLLLASQIEQLSEIDRLKREVQRLKFELDVLKNKININN